MFSPSNALHYLYVFVVFSHPLFFLLCWFGYRRTLDNVFVSMFCFRLCFHDCLTVVIRVY